jgi:PqqD family protein of HPr-rel-A system
MLNERGFVFDPNTGESYQVSATGLAMLRGLQHGATAAGLLAELVATHEVEPMKARCDLDAFLWDLKQLGWL